MANSQQNKFLETIILKATEIGGIFIIANALKNTHPIIYCSENFSLQTGFTRSEVTRKDVYLEFLHGKKTDPATKKCYMNGVLSKSNTKVQLILYNAYGFKRWFLISLIPVKNNNGIVCLFLVFFHDITHTKPPIKESPKKKWKRAIKMILKKKVVPNYTSCNKVEMSLSKICNFYNKIYIPDYKNQLYIPKWIIYHLHPIKVIWDFIMLALTVVFNAVIIPFAESFDYRNKAIDNFSIFTYVVYTIDIVMVFFTSVEKDGVLVTNHKKLRKYYLRSWFLFDIVSSFPYDLFSVSKKNVLIVIKLLKIIRIMRLIKVSQVILDLIGHSFTTLMGWFMLFCLCGHWMACVWYVIASNIDVPAVNNNSWLISLMKDGKYKSINDISLSTRYISALYYAATSLSTIGFGNIAPNTFAEKIFGIVTMILGCLAYAFIFGQVNNIIFQLSQSKNEHLSQLRELRQFNALYKIPKDIRTLAENYCIATWQVTKGTDEEKITQSIPRSLQSDLCFHIHGDVFKNESVFHYLSENALRALSRYFWTLRTFSGDKLIQQGEIVTSIYFVTYGLFEIKDGSDLIGLVGPGDSFGQYPIVEPADSKFEVIANSFSEIHVIRTQDLFESLSSFPAERDLLKYTLKLTFDLTKKKNKADFVNRTDALIFTKKFIEHDAVDHVDRLILPEKDSEDETDKVDLTDDEFNQFDSSESEVVELEEEIRNETLKMDANLKYIESQMKILLNKLKVRKEEDERFGKNSDVWTDFYNNAFIKMFSN
ncbi:potassium voltage-gated channel subfamily H member 2 isoform X1 [Hydra vulgaris]|uniref:potassium voltage-gated channel subfamily H member 2 isoform X1 n=2 Tax=Hydra vulgaris TaxID=6087 RepID=UPI0006416FC3|nr:potassium voltage-gated channel subfamily H member 2 isoform X1 [Hydra vulgaris]